MPSDTAATWNRLLEGGRGGVLPGVDSVVYGPDIGSEAEFRLLGNLAGKRVLELGCGGGQNVVAMAKQGAHAIGLDFSAEQLAAARRLADREEVRVELHKGDLAELVFLRAESIDLAFSAYALGLVTDLNRVFRQVHRVLKQGAPLVFSMPHPVAHLIDDDDPEQPLLVRRSYFDRTSVNYDWEGLPLSAHHHTVSDIFTGLSRANFRVDIVLEPEPAADGHRSPHWREVYRLVPRTLVMRARKEGI
ncbi:MAG TPA: class I SAM-dependent methyltransferase [Acidimicrobiales bacterium]|nr:class I SAM-dependent methyltransferase [Acidimicrobiales bacterium]